MLPRPVCIRRTMSKEDRVMREYVVYYLGKGSKSDDVFTDSFEEVEQFVSQCIWTYDEGRVEVYRRQKDGNSMLIKKLVIKK